MTKNKRFSNLLELLEEARKENEKNIHLLANSKHIKNLSLKGNHRTIKIYARYWHGKDMRETFVEKIKVYNPLNDSSYSKMVIDDTFHEIKSSLEPHGFKVKTLRQRYRNILGGDYHQSVTVLD